MILRRMVIGALCAVLLCLCLPGAAFAKTVAQWLEGYDSGATWFGEGYAYDVNDAVANWELLMRPITVLNVGEREVVYPLVSPDGQRVNTDKLGGGIAGSYAAVHVLGADEGGWTLIEGIDDYDRLIRGYVRTKLLKTATPSNKYGIVIDKLTQRLYVYTNGELLGSCAVSTGLMNDEQPYNETSSGEYLISSWVGGFDSEGMYVEMGIRFNNGDLLHQVPYVTLADGTKRFDKFETLLGQKASHGCVRVARIPSADGISIQWLWDNLKKGTKVVIWDDDGRVLPYPSEDTQLYYNAEGGKYYHSYATCPTVKDKYLPLTGFLYSELDTAPFDQLEPCQSCTPVKRKSVIDALNISRGVIQAPEGTQEDQLDDGGATYHPVEITIISPDT